MSEFYVWLTPPCGEELDWLVTINIYKPKITKFKVFLDDLSSDTDIKKILLLLPVMAGTCGKGKKGYIPLTRDYPYVCDNFCDGHQFQIIVTEEEVNELMRCKKIL